MKYYIDEEVNAYLGDDADRHLATNNDAQFLTPEKGIIRVTADRWKTAQTAERAHWMTLGLTAQDDRNYEHLHFFDGYQVLGNRRFGHAIELGCGPFTNLRLLAAKCYIEQCSLLDPLIESYLHHPYRKYDQNYLYAERWILSDPLRRIVRKLRRRINPQLLSRRVQVAQLLATPIETMPTTQQYDLVVIINVIEHCYDINAVFANVLATTRPGTTLIFHDKYYDAATVEVSASQIYDAAHPLRVDKKVVETFLTTHFSPLYRRVTDHEQFIVGSQMSWQSVYFIGTRL